MPNKELLFGDNKTPALVGKADRGRGFLNTIYFFSLLNELKKLI